MRIPLFQGGEQPRSRAGKIQTPLGDTRPTRVAMGNIDNATIANFTAEPQADPRPFVAAAGAVGSYGEALQQAGAVLGKIAMAKAETQNRLDRAEAEGKMASEYAAFETWKQETNAPPREWGEEWKRRAESLESLVIHDKMAPVVQDEMKESLTRFRSRSMIEVETAATKRLFEMDGELVRANYYKAIDEADLPGANAAIEELDSRGLAPADQVAKMRIDAKDGVKAKKKEKTVDAVRGFYDDNPDAVEHLLNAPEDDPLFKDLGWDNLDNGEKNQLRGEASREQNRIQARTQNILLEEAAKGKTFSKSTVMQMVEDKRLDVRDADAYLAYVERKNPTPDNPENVVSVLQGIDAYHNQEDPNGDRLVELQRAMQGFSPERTAFFKARFDARAKEKSGEAPSHPHAGTARQGIYEALAMGVFGATTKQIKEKTPVLNEKGDPVPDKFTWQTKNVRDPEKRAAARIQQADALDKLDRWLAQPANANKSRREVEAFAQSLLPKTPALSTGAGAILGDEIEDPESGLNDILNNPLFDK